MKDGTGEGYTHPDHPALANQLYAAYARAVHVRVLASVMGTDGLSETDGTFLRFGENFEKQFCNQSVSRTLDESMAVGWKLLGELPTAELTRLSDDQIERHIRSLESADA